MMIPGLSAASNSSAALMAVTSPGLTGRRDCGALSLRLTSRLLAPSTARAEAAVASEDLSRTIAGSRALLPADLPSAVHIAARDLVNCVLAGGGLPAVSAAAPTPPSVKLPYVYLDSGVRHTVERPHAHGGDATQLNVRLAWPGVRHPLHVHLTVPAGYEATITSRELLLAACADLLTLCESLDAAAYAAAGAALAGLLSDPPQYRILGSGGQLLSLHRPLSEEVLSAILSEPVLLQIIMIPAPAPAAPSSAEDAGEAMQQEAGHPMEAPFEDEGEAYGPPTLGALAAEGYSTEPAIEELQSWSEAALASVPDFRVHRRDHGSIWWPGRTDVRGLHLEEAGLRIHGGAGGGPICCEVYPDPETRPPRGTMLNKAAEVTLLHVVPQGRPDQPLPTPEEFTLRLRRKCEALGAAFLDFVPSHGVLLFEVPDFER